MKVRKIINDPVYGFISIPEGLIFELLNHPWIQRLRRIKQLGLSYLVYPGATHTRLHHSLGSLHLSQQSINTLRRKGVIIEKEEEEAVQVALLLHDLGHSPFSHALEDVFASKGHEHMTNRMMTHLSDLYGEKMTLARAVFTGNYNKPFLHELVSGQLDMDRMDYLIRDSYFTGVAEGVIGYDRIIRMLAVHEEHLAVEEKGIYSIEKFLLSRRLMYWQVYLHKTVLAAEIMVNEFMRRIKYLLQQERISLDILPGPLLLMLKGEEDEDEADYLQKYASLDDYDIHYLLKHHSIFNDKILSVIGQGIVNRHIFKIELHNSEVPEERVQEIKQYMLENYTHLDVDVEKLIFTGSETNRIYNKGDAEIRILQKNGKVKPLTSVIDVTLDTSMITKYYLCYPRI